MGVSTGAAHAAVKDSHSRPITAGGFVDGAPVVFYHFHQYGRYEDGTHELGHYPLTDEVVSSIYGTYVRALASAERRVHDVAPDFHYRRTYKNNKSLVEALVSFHAKDLNEYVLLVKRKLRGAHNVYPDEFFFEAARGDR